MESIDNDSDYEDGSFNDDYDYVDDTENYGDVDDDNNNDNDNYVDDVDDPDTNKQKPNYTVLKEEDIRRRQDDAIARVSNVLLIPKTEAIALLHHYNWRVSRVQDEWFANEYEVRKSLKMYSDKEVVVESRASSRKEKVLTCTICFEIYRRGKFTSVSCGHPFCSDCYSKYISVSIDDGPGCLMLRCPEPSCNVFVDEETINSLVSDKYKGKYLRFFIRSYVEENRNIKWCPAVGCEFAVQFDVGSEDFDVLCDCSHRFCWNCKEESHRPVDCKTVAKWILKTNSEGENMNWILVNSKACPKCNTPIEKNKGCMHMTCSPPCKHEFCWLCLKNWKGHVGTYSCNRYEKAKAVGAYSEEDRIKEMAKSVLDKYTHYYERWSSNQTSRKKAMEELNEIRGKKLKKLSETFLLTESQLQFITDAWFQIVECRRILKWTYAYGYYQDGNDKKKDLFEYLQGEAEADLERLHQFAEEELKPFFDAEEYSDKFHSYSTELIDLTKITRRHFENLVVGLENGLADVESQVSR